MNKRAKAYWIFSIVYWLIVAGCLVLFAFAFDRVHINRYGLRRSYFDSAIDENEYVSGLYNTGVGKYFIEFPSCKKYLTNLELNVSNKDMNIVGVQYSLVYRLKPGKIYALYAQLATDYESRIVAVVNVI